MLGDYAPEATPMPINDEPKAIFSVFGSGNPWIHVRSPPWRAGWTKYKERGRNVA